MTLSDQISQCGICRHYAKMIDPDNHLDLFQDAWMDVWEYEQRNPQKAEKVKNYKRYFYSVLKNRFWKKGKSKIHHLDVDRVDESQIIEVEGDDMPPVAYLLEWMSERSEDEDVLFYKNILTLAFVCKNARDAAKFCGISKSLFYIHLENAKQQLKHDYNSSATADNYLGDSLV